MQAIMAKWSIVVVESFRRLLANLIGFVLWLLDQLTWCVTIFKDSCWPAKCIYYNVVYLVGTELLRLRILQKLESLMRCDWQCENKFCDKCASHKFHKLPRSICDPFISSSASFLNWTSQPNFRAAVFDRRRRRRTSDRFNIPLKNWRRNLKRQINLGERFSHHYLRNALALIFGWIWLHLLLINVLNQNHFSLMNRSCRQEW